MIRIRVLAAPAAPARAPTPFLLYRSEMEAAPRRQVAVGRSASAADRHLGTGSVGSECRGRLARLGSLAIPVAQEPAEAVLRVSAVGRDPED
jgi:hypothetical protein